MTLSDGSAQPGAQFIKGTKAALYDAVALLVTEQAAAELATIPEARDFVTEAHVNFKVVGWVAGAKPLAVAAGVTPDDGWVPMDDAKAAVKAFGALRFWERDVTK